MQVVRGSPWTPQGQVLECHMGSSQPGSQLPPIHQGEAVHRLGETLSQVLSLGVPAKEERGEQ